MGSHRAWVSQSWSLRFTVWSVFFRQEVLDKAQRWLLDEEMLLERKVLKNPIKLKIIKRILMVEEKRNWMLWVVKELVLEWNNEGAMKEWVIYSWMEVTLTFLGKEGWKSIAKGWVYLASGAPSALSIRWALVSFCRKWRSSPCSQGWWGKEKLERFHPLGAQADKRCTSGDE